MQVFVVGRAFVLLRRIEKPLHTGRLLCVLGLRHDLLLCPVLVEVRHEEHAALLGGQQQVLAVALVAHDFLADAFGQVVYGAVGAGRRCLHLLRAARLVFAQDCCRDEDGKGGDYVDQDARTVRDLLREAVAIDVALVIQTRLHRPIHFRIAFGHPVAVGESAARWP